MSRHADIEELLALAHGEIEGSAAATILEHARSCRECGDHLAVMLALREETAASLPSTTDHKMGWIAASVLLAVLLGMVLVAGGVFDAAEQPSPLRELATAEAPNRIDMDFLFDATLPISDDTLQAQKRDGFQLVVDGRYGDAVALFSDLRNEHPDDPSVAACLGIARYLSGDTSDRVEGLLIEGRGAWLQGMQHYSTWYLGNHYLRQGDLVQAMEVLEDIAQQPDSPGRRAAELLRRLQLEDQR